MTAKEIWQLSIIKSMIPNGQLIHPTRSKESFVRIGHGPLTTHHDLGRVEEGVIRALLTLVAYVVACDGVEEASLNVGLDGLANRVEVDEELDAAHIGCGGAW